MKKIILIIFLILFLVLAVLAIFFLRKSDKNISSEEPQAVAENKVENTGPSIKATPKNYGESSEKYKYQIQFVYPFFEGLDDKKIQDSINMQVEKKSQVEIDKYIAEARKNKIAPIFGYLTAKYDFSVESDNILSIKIEMEKYLSGASSPQSIQAIWNYDLKTGNEILPSGAKQ